MTVMTIKCAEASLFPPAPSAPVHGFNNPVRAALAFLRGHGEWVKIDEASFERVAEVVGDVPIDGGFLVDSVEKLGRLCELGGFAILNRAGDFTAMLTGEMEAFARDAEAAPK